MRDLKTCPSEFLVVNPRYDSAEAAKVLTRAWQLKKCICRSLSKSLSVHITCIYICYACMSNKNFRLVIPRRNATASIERQSAVRAGETINVPANAPHQFHNSSTRSARMLCICSPAGQEQFFLELGVPVATRTAPSPKLDDAAQSEFKAKAAALASKYRTELLQRA